MMTVMVVVAPLSIRQRRDGRRPRTASSVVVVVVVVVVNSWLHGPRIVQSAVYVFVSVGGGGGGGGGTIKVRSYGTQLSVLSTK